MSDHSWLTIVYWPLHLKTIELVHASKEVGRRRVVIITVQLTVVKYKRTWRNWPVCLTRLELRWDVYCAQRKENEEYVQKSFFSRRLLDLIALFLSQALLCPIESAPWFALLPCDAVLSLKASELRWNATFTVDAGCSLVIHLVEHWSDRVLATLEFAQFRTGI